MAIYLGDNISVQIPKPLDAKYLNNTVPYTGDTAVNTAIPIGLRSVGLTVNINGVEYWYATSGDVISGTLTIKDSGIASTGITAAINGLTKIGNAVSLGGTLTGTTTITDSRGGSAVGIQYGGDYSANFTARSLIDAAYVTGKTCQAIQTACNGLTKNGQNVVLGGSLTGATGIDLGANLHCLYSTASGGCICTYMANGSDESQTHQDSTSICLYGYNSSGPVSGSILIGGPGTCGDVHIHGENCVHVGIATSALCLDIRPTEFLISTYPAKYAADYSPFTAHQIPDAAWVTGCTSTALSYAITGACNGLTKNGQTVNLGGTLTGDTTISGNAGSYDLSLTGLDSFNLGFDNVSTITDGDSNGGLRYAGDYSGNYTPRSLVDAGYVTGKTSVLCADINYISGVTDTKVDKTIASVSKVIYSNGTELTGCTNMIYCDGSKSFSFGRSNCAYGNDSGVFGGASNRADASCSIVLGGQNNNIDASSNRAAIIGSQNIALSGATYNDTTAVECLAVMNGVGCTDNLLCVNTTTGKVGYTSLSAFGGLSGATNGLHTCGQDVLLGGILSADTSICGGGLYDLCLGKSTSKLDYLWVNANCACVITGNLGIDSSGATYTDLRAGTGRTGILYAVDYSLGFLPRSLVDKGYVDSVATGLNVHTAVKVATTGAIILVSGQTIDGIVVSNPDRVLVKNQGVGVTGNTANGIYVVVDAGAWTRADDYNFSPSGEVANGDLIPVITGDTQNNTLWALTTLNPIVSGTTLLIFSLFGSVIDVQAGAGIAVSQVGGVHTICVNLGSNSGLNTASGLVIGAGCGLSTSGGVLNINAASCGAAPAIPVGYNAGDCLVVACADILGVMVGAGTLTGATNGLGTTSGKVCLGGILVADTTICGNSSYDLNLTCLCDFRLGFGAGTGAATITDTNGTPKGLQYAADYSAGYTLRSLVDKAYVTGCTACARAIALVAITGVTNGLTCVATHCAKLGGTLCEATTINTSTQNLCFCGTSGIATICKNFVIVNGATNVCLNATNSGNTGQIFIGSPQASDITTCSNNSITNSTCQLILDFSCVGTVYDAQSHGLQYGGDYSATFCDNSLVTKQYVCSQTSGITGNYLCAADNGLHKSGNNTVSLGGSLTGTTTINTANNPIYFCANGLNRQIYLDTTEAKLIFSGACGTGNVSVQSDGVTITSQNNTCVASIYLSDTDNKIQFNSAGAYRAYVDSTGLNYCANYAGGATNCWLTDKFYVDNQICCYTSGITCAITTADNGLTKSGQNVSLGGILTGDTIIDITASWNLAVTSSSIGLKVFGVDGSVILGDPSCGARYLKLGSSGLEVDAKTDGISLITTAGGSICILNSADCVSLNTTAGSYVTLKDTCVNINGNGGTMTVSDAATKGLVYGGAYEANFTCLSLVTANYVTGLTSCAITIAPEAITGATNGLTKFDCHNACLGGSLTSNVNIDLNSRTFTVCGAQAANFICLDDSTLASSFGLQCGACAASTTLQAECHSLALLSGAAGAIFTDLTVSTPRGIQYNSDYSATFCDNSLITKRFVDTCVCAVATGITGNYLCAADNGLHKSGNNTVSLGGNLTGNTTIGAGVWDLNINVVNLNLSGSTVITLSGATIKIGEPVAGTNSDAVLVWDSADSTIKKIPSDSLGEKNNIYSYTAVTGTVALVTGSSYVIYTDSTAAAFAITLPDPPQNGQAFKFKDCAGTALSNNVTIDAGAGYFIDGSQCALINTDFGAIEVHYAGGNKWFSLSMVI